MPYRPVPQPQRDARQEPVFAGLDNLCIIWPIIPPIIIRPMLMLQDPVESGPVHFWPPPAPAFPPLAHDSMETPPPDVH